jgi:hypothetical protein
MEHRCLIYCYGRGIDIGTILPPVILRVAKDLKKVEREAVERQGLWR